MYLFAILLASIVGWTGWFTVLYRVNPFGKSISLVLFYISLFFALAGTFTLIGFYIRVFISKNEIYFENINVSLRQGILLSICTIAALVFQSFRVLTWLTGILLVSILILFEIYLITEERR